MSTRRLRGTGGAAALQRGFTYIGLLVAVFIMGLMLTVVARIWSTTERRERETQLLWVGHEYRKAIASYYASGRRFPATLQELLQDERTPIPRHHLRRLYPDPITGQADWKLLLTPNAGGIMGIASSSQGAPIKRDGFDPVDAGFKDADCYCTWQFIFFPSRYHRMLPGTPTTMPPGSLSTPAGPSDPAPVSGAPGTSP